MLKKNESLKILAIIPARGGSKGLARKNLRLLAGKPLLSYTIETAQQAPILSHVLVSTEDEEIAQYARSFDIKVYRHPEMLSTDQTPSFHVVKWALNEFRRIECDPAIVVVLKATSPLRSVNDINNAVQMLLADRSADSVVSVVKTQGTHPSRLRRIVDGKWLSDAFESEGCYPKIRQEHGSLYSRNGAIYVSLPTLIDNDCLWSNRCLPYVMPEARSVNINSEFDLRIAEFILDNSLT
jgi:CMP-N-acetylneuraminic acid synthetase